MEKKTVHAFNGTAEQEEQLKAVIREHHDQPGGLMPVLQGAQEIYGYLPYNQEVRTWPILERARQDGKRVAVPKCYGKEMRFLWLDDFTQVAEGAYTRAASS